MAPSLPFEPPPAPHAHSRPCPLVHRSSSRWSRRSRGRCLSPHSTYPTYPTHFFRPRAFPVRDLSHTSVSIAPADYASWHDVRTELMAEAKTGFKARVESELAASGGYNNAELKAAFQQARAEHELTMRPGLVPDPDPFPSFPHSRRSARSSTRLITRSTRFPVRWPSNLRPATLEHVPDVLTLNPSPYPASVDVSYNFLSH